VDKQTIFCFQIPYGLQILSLPQVASGQHNELMARSRRC